MVSSSWNKPQQACHDTADIPIRGQLDPLISLTSVQTALEEISGERKKERKKNLCRAFENSQAFEKKSWKNLGSGLQGNG